MHFQIVLVDAGARRRERSPRLGGFPVGLPDRAFYARVADAADVRARFSRLNVKALAVEVRVTGFKAR
jgi:hypothetical protein